MNKPTVAMGLFAGLMDFAVSRGAVRSRLCREASIDAAQLTDPDVRVPLNGFKRALQFAKQETDQPAFALEFGQAIGMSEISIVGLLMEASETVGHAYQQLRRYGRLAVETTLPDQEPRFTLDTNDGRLLLVDRQPWSHEFPELTECGFAWLACGPRRYMDRSPVIAAKVTWSKPDYWRSYEEILQCRVEFGADCNALAMHPQSLDWTVQQNPQYVFGVLAERADELLESLRAKEDLTSQVRSLVSKILHEGDPSAERTAKELGMSRQTLFRRLRNEGTSFSALLRELRLELAMQYLRGSKASLSEIAYLVGYSEVATFNRAFKRWTGMTPGSARG